MSGEGMSTIRDCAERALSATPIVASFGGTPYLSSQPFTRVEHNAPPSAVVVHIDDFASLDVRSPTSWRGWRGRPSTLRVSDCVGRICVGEPRHEKLAVAIHHAEHLHSVRRLRRCAAATEERRTQQQMDAAATDGRQC